MADEVTMQSADVALKEKSEVAVLTQGTSMYPLFRSHRDIAVIERVTRPLKVNDVPLYRKKGVERLVLHRIVALKKDGYVIRGDNLTFNEYDVKDSDIVGVLKAFYRNGVYYDCATSKKYKRYVFFTRLTYPIRFVYGRLIRPILSRVKRILKKLFWGEKI